MEGTHVASISRGETSVTSSAASLGESDPLSEIPWWVQWISTAILSLIFIIGLPLNGATVLIFFRRKKLRHLVNFVLLLDCLSHIVLCLLCIPLHLVAEWTGPSTLSSNFPVNGSLFGIANLQQVVGNFVNLYSTFLTVSIAILRYRRLCWKKKDKFSAVNAFKWSATSGILAIGVTVVQCYVVVIPEGGNTIAAIYLGKISIILFAVVTVFFCYVRVSQRVWANTANQEKTMDPAKLKKSRSVHMKATIHSCVQIVLVVTTVTPHLYLQALEMLAASSSSTHQALWNNSGSNTGASSAGSYDHAAEPVVLSSATHQQHFSIHNLHQQQQHPHHAPILGESGGNSGAASDWMDGSLTFPRQPYHESLSGSNNIINANTEDGFRTFEMISNTSAAGCSGTGSSTLDADGGTREKVVPVGIDSAAAAARLTTFGTSLLAKLIAITVNYALLALGTPCAYIASCHRFREQFASILFSHVANSPQNSTCHHHQHGHQHSSPGHKPHHRERYYHHRSTTGGTHDACFSSPLTRADRTSTTVLQNQSSLMSRNSSHGHNHGTINGSSIVRESVSISISGNTRSSFSHSFKSRSSVRKGSVCGSSMKRRKSSGATTIGASAVCGGGSSGGKGLLGVSVAADSVFMESDSALILEQDVSNGSSSTGNTKPTPSPTAGDEVSARGSSGELVRQNSSSHLSHLPLTAVTTITSNSSNLHTYLQNYGDYECGTDLGQLV